jgi:streptogramin lyase
MPFRKCLFVIISAVSVAASVHAGSAVDALRITDEIRGNDAGFEYATVDPIAGVLYVGRTNGVMSVDLKSKAVTAVLVPGARVHAVVLLPGGRLLSTNSATNTVTLADRRTGEIFAEVRTGYRPDGAVYDPKSGLVFVMNGDDGNAALIDPESGSLVGRVAVGGTLAQAVADDDGQIYVNVGNRGEIAVIDSIQRRVVRRFSLPNCTEPSGIDYDPTASILLSVCQNRKAVAVDARDGSIAAVLAVDRNPDAVIFDASRETFFVPCAREATMIAISSAGGMPHVVRKIPTAIGARAGALDPRTGQLYLPAADYSISLAGIRQKPGTFRILVIGAAHS